MQCLPRRARYTLPPHLLLPPLLLPQLWDTACGTGVSFSAGEAPMAAPTGLATDSSTRTGACSLARTVSHGQLAHRVLGRALPATWNTSPTAPGNAGKAMRFSS